MFIFGFFTYCILIFIAPEAGVDAETVENKFIYYSTRIIDFGFLPAVIQRDLTVTPICVSTTAKQKKELKGSTIWLNLWKNFMGNLKQETQVCCFAI